MSQPGALSDLFLRRFLVSYALGLAVVAFLNMLVDPQAKYGTRLLRPLVWMAREEKTELLRLKKEAPPEVIVFGSSRAMKLEPKYISEKTGLRAFNAAIQSARVEDHLEMLRFLVADLSMRPKAVIVGLDIYTFADGSGGDLSFLKEALSYDHVSMSLKSIYYRLTAYPAEKAGFDEDGFLTYYVYERQIRDGTFQLEPEVEATVSQYLERWLGFDALSEKGKRDFERLLDTCRENGIKVYVYIPPMHPRMLRALEEGTPYRRLHQDLLAFLESLRSAHDFVFLDASRAGALGGDDSLFYDGVHPREENNRLILDRLLPRGGA